MFVVKVKCHVCDLGIAQLVHGRNTFANCNLFQLILRYIYIYIPDKVIEPHLVHHHSHPDNRGENNTPAFTYSFEVYNFTPKFTPTAKLGPMDHCNDAFV